jgi:putative ubiquitin-RnfH superfamily antitoxin RatB of RatAB toxin-antitoxin module
MLLRRTASVEDYTDKFLALACRDADLTVQQLIQMFTSGLVNPLKIDVALRHPQTLDDAIMLARAYEQRHQLSPSNPGHSRSSHAAHAHAASTAPKGDTVAPSPASASSAPPGSGKTTPLSSTLPRRRLSPSEMAQHRADGLCYNCDEKFIIGHCCKKLFIMEVTPDEDDEEVDEVIECAALTCVPSPPEISLHAITGVRAKGFQTMKVYVSMGDTVAVALLDSGSSHNFIDIDMACRVGIMIRPSSGLSVAVANGERFASPGKTTAQTVFIGGEAFHINLYALPLGEYDMVLGIQWLTTLGPVLWDFAKHKMAFARHGKRVLWRGIDTTQGLATATLTGRSEAALLEEFASLFMEPQGLPPPGHLSHRIRLKPGIGAVAVCPYRYAHAQKNELECQCDDMLRLGIIRPSSSSFSSPVLLICKHDATWRLCVDYIALNDATVKDKFPIPVVEEFLDELQGARFFTNLDM